MRILEQILFPALTKQINDCPLSPNDVPRFTRYSRHYRLMQADTLISLYGGQRWEEDLLGYWRLSGNKMVFVEGALIQALRQQKSVDLNNAPWDNADFVRFWQEAFLYGYIKTRQGETLTLPANFRLMKSQDYPWQALSSALVPRIDGTDMPNDVTCS